MKTEFKNNKAYITDCAFEPEQVFENGQFFRYKKNEEGSYAIIAGNKRLNVDKREDTLILEPCSPDVFESFWRRFLDLDTDYNNLFEDCSDENLKSAMRKYPGLKVLKQNPYEAAISFIISANNNIKRIKGIIERICEKYGEKISDEFGEYYSFPAPDQLSRAAEEELKELGCGYRAPYIADTARVINGGSNLEELRDSDYSEAKKKLMELKGVGPKVADCILLFSLGHYNAFPKDVWVKRVMSDLYGISGSDAEVQAFAEQKFGKYAGIAQQYLFYAARNGKL